ncbi:uncharacterized protein EAE97_011032 [Botrytis byssoidea]|uniref:Uncharacterized protein n=1 Tax=Botrytis byssoidea TaxID=139641 RepID=A0A9P5LIP6_9HELO|nr:uncharacterized protein EAE97_011032 [Botrytis byssoidea]KAF7922868.1 hypothetical protein EAE97_011032 [Botrytis byssoidea]
MDEYYQNPHYPVPDAGENTMDEYDYPLTGAGDNTMDEFYNPVIDAGDNTMDEYHQNPYYPITDPQQYSSFPLENADMFADPDQDIDFHFLSRQLQLHNEHLQNENDQLQLQYNQLQRQHSDLQDKQNDLQDKHDELQSRHRRLQLHIHDDPIAAKRLLVAARKIYSATLAQDDDEHEAPAENVAPAGGHRYITRSTQKTQPAVMGKPVEDDDSNLTSDVEYAPGSESVSDEEMENEDYEPTTKSVAPATAAHQEVRFAVKKDLEQNMLIYHRKPSAYRVVFMTKEEFYHVRGGTRVAPRTFSTPDENGNIQDYVRIRITEAESERLDAWRARHGRKPHEIREGTKDAAAREL